MASGSHSSAIPLLAPKPEPSLLPPKRWEPPRKPKHNVSVACTTCKRRKVKCSGCQPCQTCVRHSVDCVYEVHKDGRRLNRRAIVAEEENARLQKILDRIKVGNDDDISEAVKHLRGTDAVAPLEGQSEERAGDYASSLEQPDTGIYANDEIEVRACQIQHDWQQHGKFLSPSHSTAPNTTISLIPSAALSGYFSIPHFAVPESLQSQPRLTQRAVSEQPSLIENFSPFSKVPMMAAPGNSHHHQCLREYLKSSKSWHAVLISDPEYLERATCTCWRCPASTTNRKFPRTTLFTFGPDQQEESSWRHQLGWFNTFGNLPGSSAIRCGGFPQTIEEQQLQIYEKPEWTLRPMAFDDGSPFCRVYVSFIDAAQALIDTGTPIGEILGSENPKVDLFFRSHRDIELNDVSSCVSSWISCFSELEPAARLAWILSIVRLMRWMISPSAESFAKLSRLQRPSIVQLMLPHTATIDLVPQPDVRDALCRTPRDFITPAKGCSINWPKLLTDAIEINCVDGSLCLTQEFQNHALDTENWTYSRAFVAAFPEIAACLPVKDG